MKDYIYGIISSMLVCLGCNPVIQNNNTNNPISFQKDSILIAYYLTNEKEELTTTFKAKETIEVHYDITNRSQQRFLFAHDYEYLYPYLIFGKCYNIQGTMDEQMTFWGCNLNDTLYSRRDRFPIFSLLPNETWKGKRTLEADSKKGGYYFEIEPKLQVYKEEKDSIPMYVVEIPIQKIEFNIIGK